MSYEVPIERGKIREFARATGAEHERYQEPLPPVPPTFLTTAGNLWCPPDERAMKDLDLDLERLLHAEEEFAFPGPPPTAGQTLTAASRLDDQWTKEGRRGGTLRFTRLVTEFRDSSGSCVAEQRTTFVETSRPPTEESR